jgi:hypothetical protein
MKISAVDDKFLMVWASEKSINRQLFAGSCFLIKLFIRGDVAHFWIVFAVNLCSEIFLL